MEYEDLYSPLCASYSYMYWDTPLSTLHGDVITLHVTGIAEGFGSFQFFSNTDSGNPSRFYATTPSGGIYSFYIVNPQGDVYSFNTTEEWGNIFDGETHEVTLDTAEDSVSIYIDGNLVASKLRADYTGGISGTFNTIAGTNSSNNDTGVIYDVDFSGRSVWQIKTNNPSVWNFNDEVGGNNLNVVSPPESPTALDMVVTGTQEVPEVPEVPAGGGVNSLQYNGQYIVGMVYSNSDGVLLPVEAMVDSTIVWNPSTYVRSEVYDLAYPVFDVATANVAVTVGISAATITQQEREVYDTATTSVTTTLGIDTLSIAQIGQTTEDTASTAVSTTLNISAQTITQYVESVEDTTSTNVITIVGISTN